MKNEVLKSSFVTYLPTLNKKDCFNESLNKSEGISHINGFIPTNIN